jgi:leader peptidase (prepilin peptidase) / N-methyltransferase
VETPDQIVSVSIWLYYWGTFAFLLGAVVGSFLNVVIYRLPVGESVVTPGSRCPKCLKPIRPYDNIPILGWLLLAGKCRDCGAGISIRYPLTELAMASISLWLFLVFDISAAFGIYFVFCAGLVAVFWIDIDHLIIPNEISLNGIPVGMIASIFGLLPGMDARSTLLGAVLGFAILFIPAILYEKIRGVEGLGGGDIWLLTMMGAFLGPYGVIMILFIASFSGCIVALAGMFFMGKESSTRIPFGPFLASGAIVYVFFGQEVISYVFTPGHAN